MPFQSTHAFLNALRQLQIANSAELEKSASTLQPKSDDPKVLARQLVKDGTLTVYQVNQLFKDAGQALDLDEYCLLEPLGKGGMGQVFKARHRLMNRIVAVKIIRPELLNDPQSVARFRREIQLAARLSHPNIITAYDAKQVDDRHFLVMEFCEGQNLGDLVRKKGPLPILEACEYVRQTALGLQHAFEQGMIHRDIKPENLLLAGGIVKILDMGLARIGIPDDEADATDLTHDKALMGTPNYIAPEQARNIRNADIRSDLYSLGCTFYFLLTGSVPFPGGTATEKILRHELEQPQPLGQLRPEVPGKVIQIVQRLTAKDPDSRYQTAADLAAAVGQSNQHFLNAERDPLSTVAFSDSNPLASNPPGKRRRVRNFVVSVIGVLLLLLVCLGAWIIFDRLNKVSDSLPDAFTDRQAALWIIENGGSVTVWEREKKRSNVCGHQSELPIGTFRLVGVHMPENPHAGDKEMNRFRNLKHVEFVTLGSEHISDNGLAWLMNCSKLKWLELKYAKVTDDMLGKLSQQLRQIDSLRLDACPNVTSRGMEHLHQLAFLKRINLKRIAIDQSGLQHFSKIKSLQSLSLTFSRSAQIKSNFWKHLAQLTQLNHLSVESFHLTDGGMKQIGTMGHLKFLHISAVHVTNQGAAHLRDLNQLNRLSLDSMKLNNEALAILEHMPLLTDLDLVYMKQVDGSALIHVRNLSNLERLDLKKSAIGDAGLVHLQSLPKLRELNLRGTKVTNAGLKHFRMLKQLTLLNLLDTDVTDFVVSPLKLDLPKCQVLVSNFRWPWIIRHDETINCVAFSPDSKKLAFAAANDVNPNKGGVVKLFDLATREEIACLQGHADEVRCVAFSPNGKILASAGCDLNGWKRKMVPGQVNLWDMQSVKTAQTKKVLKAHAGGTWALAFTQFGGESAVATGGHDGKIKFWDPNTGKMHPSFAEHARQVYALAVHPKKNWVVASGGADGNVRLWDAVKQREMKSLPDAEQKDREVFCLAFSPDGRKLAAAFQNPNQRIADPSTISLWDVSGGKLVNNATLEEPLLRFGCITFTPDGKSILAGMSDGCVRRWDAKDLKQLPSPAWVPKTNARVWSIAFSPDRKHVALATSNVAHVWAWPPADDP